MSLQSTNQNVSKSYGSTLTLTFEMVDIDETKQIKLSNFYRNLNTKICFHFIIIIIYVHL